MTSRPVLLLALLFALALPAHADFVGLSAEVVATDLSLDGRQLGTLRLYAHFDSPLDSGYLIQPVVEEFVTSQGVVVDLLFPWSVETSDPLGFWQHPLGANTSAGIDPTLLPANPALAFDSWFTLGAEDAAGNLLSELNVDWAGFEGGGALSEIDGALFVPAFSAQSFVVGERLLVGQFTVGMGETVSGSLNLQCLDPQGITYEPRGVNFLYQVCATPAVDLSHGGENSLGWYAKLGICGALGDGEAATLTLRRAPANATALLLASLGEAPFFAKGGIVVPALPWALTVARTTDAQGEIALPVPGTALDLDVAVQWLVADAPLPSGVASSNALRLRFGG